MSIVWDEECASPSAPTPGPWRWADHGAEFGTIERRDRFDTLESNGAHGAAVGPVVRRRDDDCRGVLHIDDEVSEADARLIASAPELRDALAEMLAMFGGNMDRARYRAYKQPGWTE